MVNAAENAPRQGLLEGQTLYDLGYEAAFFLFGFRASAHGRLHCCVVVRGFDAAFQNDASQALEDLARFTRLLGHGGRRKIVLAQPGCSRITADEVCLTAALAAAQAGEERLCAAHLGWLFAGAVPEDAFETFDRLAAAFASHGLWVSTPEGPKAPTTIDLRLAPVAGSA